MKRPLAILTAAAMLPLFTGCGLVSYLMMNRQNANEAAETPLVTEYQPETAPPTAAVFTTETAVQTQPAQITFIEPETEAPTESMPEYAVKLADWADVQWTQYQCAYFTLTIPAGWQVEWNGNAEQLTWQAHAPDNTMIGLGNIDHVVAYKDARTAAILGAALVFPNGTVQEYFETLFANTTDYFTVQNACVPANKEQLQSLRSDKAIWDYESLYAIFSENGVEGEGVYSACIMEAPDLILTGGYNYAMWEINGTFMEYAPRGELVNWQPVYQTIAQSFTYTDYYWDEWRSRLGSSTSTTSTNSINDSDPIVEAFEERSTADTILQEKRSDMIGEYERVYDNETGNIYRAYNGFLDDIGPDQTRYSAITDSQYADGYVGWIDK